MLVDPVDKNTFCLADGEARNKGHQCVPAAMLRNLVNSQNRNNWEEKKQKKQAPNLIRHLNTYTAKQQKNKNITHQLQLAAIDRLQI